MRKPRPTKYRKSKPTKWGTLRIGETTHDICSLNPNAMDAQAYEDDQVEFMLACQREKDRLGRMLRPAEILRVAQGLGYKRIIDLQHPLGEQS